MKDKNKRNTRNKRNRRDNRSRRPREEEPEWIPITKLGKQVKSGEIVNIESILEKNLPIKEEGISNTLIPNLSTDLLLVGQAKGKFGGGQRRVFRVTQKKTCDGNRPKFLAMSVAGNNDGIVGLGVGSARETVPARNKATKESKKHLIKIKRGCGSWECGCGEPHSIPFSVTGRCSSVEITLFPAPKGIGLCVNDECKKVLKLAGIKDIWSKTKGKTSSRMNLMRALLEALKQLSKYHLNEKYAKNVHIVDGRLK